MNNIGVVIKMARLSVGMKQNELARKMGISPQQLSGIESGRRLPSIHTLKIIEHYLGKGEFIISYIRK